MLKFLQSPAVLPDGIMPLFEGAVAGKIDNIIPTATIELSPDKGTRSFFSSIIIILITRSFFAGNLTISLTTPMESLCMSWFGIKPSTLRHQERGQFVVWTFPRAQSAPDCRQSQVQTNRDHLQFARQLSLRIPDNQPKWHIPTGGVILTAAAPARK